MKYKIAGTGIDTASITYRPDSEYSLETVYIDTDSNNSFYLTEFIVGRNLVVRIGDVREDVLAGLKNDLGDSFSGINILLIPASSLDFDQEELREIIDKYNVEALGIDRPESLQQFKEAADRLKHVMIPSYVSLDLSPLHFQHDIVEEAGKLDIEILGFNPFSGFLSSGLSISTFTIPFLLEFAAAYSVVVFLSGRDLVSATYNSDYLVQLIGKEQRDGGSLYKMTGNINRLVKNIPPLINTALRLNGEKRLGYNNPEYISDPTELEIGMEKLKEEKGDTERIQDEKESEIVRDISRFIALSKLRRENETGETYLSRIRPEIVRELEKKGWEIEQAKIGNTTFLIDVKIEEREKRYAWFDKTWINELFFTLSLDDNGNLEFNSLE